MTATSFEVERASDDGRLEAFLVTAAPTDAEHGPVREGLERGVFDRRGEGS